MPYFLIVKSTLTAKVLLRFSKPNENSKCIKRDLQDLLDIPEHFLLHVWLRVNIN